MNNPTRVSELSAKYIQQDDPTGWFEELYSQAEGETGQIPWAKYESQVEVGEDQCR